MLWAVGGSVVLGMIALIGFTLAIPDLKTVEAAPLPLLAIAGYWLPSWLVKVFVAFVVFSMFAILVVGSGAQARLVYSMSRDNMLPGSKLLRSVNAQTKTPIPALGVSYVICVGVMIFGYNSSNAFGFLVGATALVPYIVYLLTVIAYGIKRPGLERLPGAFHLGRFAVPVFVGAFVWLVVALLALSLPSDFHKADYYAAGGIGLAALWWVTGLRSRLQHHTAGVVHIPEQSTSVDLNTGNRTSIGG